MKTTIYANYGVLASEKQTVYTVVPHIHATLSEPVTIDIPESVNPRENEAGEIIVTLDGTPYLLSEVLSNAGNKPAFRWYNGQGYKTLSLAEYGTEDE